MNRFDPRLACAIALLSLLTACGGSAGGDPEAAPATSAALEVHGPAPVADCEAEGCSRPRVIDGLAEQYRASAQPAEPAEQAPAASEAAPAAAG